MVDNTEVQDYSSDSSTDNEGLLQKIKSKPRIAKEEVTDVSVSHSGQPPQLTEETPPAPKPKAKKPRSKKQIEAFEKARKVRAEKIALKKQVADDKRAEAYLARKAGKKKPDKREPTVEELQEQDVTRVVKKKKPRKVREVVKYETESESSDTEEVVVVKKVKKNRKKKSGIQKEPKYEEDVEDTEIEPPRSSIYYV